MRRFTCLIRFSLVRVFAVTFFADTHGANLKVNRAEKVTHSGTGRVLASAMPAGRFVAFLLLLCTIVSESTAQKYLFGKSTFPTGAKPFSIASGDFRGKGLVDLAVVNAGDNTVSVLLAKPGGNFEPHVDYATGDFPTSVVVGDFNRDGKLDLAVANLFSNSVSILLGNGDGTFRPQISVFAGQDPSSVVAGDFNRDGQLDLAVVNEGTANTVSILLGNGDGTFKPPVAYGTGNESIRVVAGDFNKDGILDLAVANHFGNSVSILLGKGDGTFEPETEFSTDILPDSIAAGDFNHDGKLDIAVGTDGGTISILLGNGNGTFLPAMTFNTGRFVAISSLVATDFNGGGKADLAVAQDIVVVFLGNGDGTFGLGVPYPALHAGALIATDLNGDGHLDIVVTNENCPGNPCLAGSVTALLGNGDGTFDTRSFNPTGLVPNSIAIGDFNGDRKLDVAVANSPSGATAGNISVFLGEGNGRFGSHAEFPAGTDPLSIVSGDFNADGRLDLVVADGSGCCSNSTVSIFLGKGDGTFSSGTTFEVGSSPVALARGDLNGDGKLDLVVANQGSGSVSVLLGKGDGTFQAEKQYPLGANSSPTSVTLGDFNRDGKLDIAVGLGFSTVAILQGNGDGTFRPPSQFSTGFFAPFSLAAGDFNRDGKLDLAAVTGDGITLLFGNGDGSFQSPVHIGSGISQFSPLLAVDLTGDGKLDLIVVDDNSLSVLLGNGDGTFGSPLPIAGGNITAAAAGDFNGDGVLDMALADSSLIGMSAYLETPNVAFFPQRPFFSGQAVGTTSHFQKVTLTDAGAVPLSLSSIGIAGNFAETTSCPLAPVRIAPTASCNFNITFSPTGPGPRTGILTTIDNAAGSPHKVVLTGFGLAPIVKLFPTSVTFADQLVGTSSPPQSVTLSNTGNAPLSISGMLPSGDFAISSKTCGSSLAAGSNCAIGLIFHPTGAGSRLGTLSISDNAIGSPQKVSLGGVGTLVSLSPSSLNFGNQKVGTPSASKPVVVKNTGKTTLTIGGISITGTNSGDFYISSKTCGRSVAAGASCSVSVRFKPTAKGTRTADLRVSDNGGGSPQKVSLTGTGT